MTKDTIACPQCDFVQGAIIENWIGAFGPCASYVHTCIKCGYVIMESEWDSLRFARERCYSLDEIKELARGCDEPKDYDGDIHVVANGQDGVEYWFVEDGDGWKVAHTWSGLVLV